MAVYVVDASIVIQRFIRDSYTMQARTLFDGLKLSDKLYVPEFCLLECTNVLWKQVRFQGMPEQQAIQAIINLNVLPLRILKVRGRLISALQIGLEYKLALYDSVYVAMALQLKCPPITVDEKQKNAALASGVSVKPITDFMPSTE